MKDRQKERRKTENLHPQYKSQHQARHPQWSSHHRVPTDMVSTFRSVGSIIPALSAVKVRTNTVSTRTKAQPGFFLIRKKALFLFLRDSAGCASLLGTSWVFSKPSSKTAGRNELASTISTSRTQCRNQMLFLAFSQCCSCSCNVVFILLQSCCFTQTVTSTNGSMLMIWWTLPFWACENENNLLCRKTAPDARSLVKWEREQPHRQLSFGKISQPIFFLVRLPMISFSFLCKGSKDGGKNQEKWEFGLFRSFSSSDGEVTTDESVFCVSARGMDTMTPRRALFLCIGLEIGCDFFGLTSWFEPIQRLFIQDEMASFPLSKTGGMFHSGRMCKTGLYLQLQTGGI